MMKNLPFFTCGKIIKGFGRGSSELGIPTANFPLEVVQSLPPDFSTGVYYGWAKVDDGPVHKMVMSIGWNPYYNNVHKSMETHILHKFPSDLYNCCLRVAICGYIRPETNFKSVEELIAQIHRDIEQAESKLDAPNMIDIKKNEFFN